MHCFGTPDLLDDAAFEERGTPVVPSIDRATCWEFPSRESIAAACEDASPGRFYPRYGHGAGLVCEAWVARLENAGGALLFGSGMAAISAVLMTRVDGGQRLGLSRKTYGGTVAVAEHELPRFGVEVVAFDPFDEASLATMLAREPAHVHVESPVNPTGRVLDLAAIAERVHAVGATLSCDATFMPPPFQRCCELGVDYSIHSATKFLGGHSDLLAGVVSGSVDAIARLERWRRRTGAVLPPDESWLLRRSLETLELRTRAACASATEIARFLEQHPKVERVHAPCLETHPDHALAAERTGGIFGAVFSFEIAGGEEAATRCYDALRVFRRSVSLGGVESLASMPIDTSHHALSDADWQDVGFARHAMRLSVGLEPVDELRTDLEQALGS